MSRWISLLLTAGMLLLVPVTRGQSVPPYTVFMAHHLVVTQAQDSDRVTLDLHDVTVQDALHQIVQQTGMALMWSRARVPLNGRISVTLHGVLVRDALAAILHGSDGVAKISPDGQTIMIVRGAKVLNAERQGDTGIITGRVTDSASGAGLGGASVRVDGTKISTITADSGQFSLRNVPAGDQVLSVRLFGYRPVERTVTVVDSQRTTVHIVMASVPTVLSGVVTTATGLQRKVEVGNDITTLNVDSIMQVAPIASVTDLLETRVPGLTVLHSSGVPGDPSRIRLRGVSSITGNSDPIVVVDGVRVYASQSDPRNANLAPSLTGGSDQGNPTVGTKFQYAAPSPLDQIDPNSIETIEVFKGPSASALYGSDAANGVIVITTKHGRAGPSHWNLVLGDGVNWLPGNWPVNYYKFGADAVSPDFYSRGLCLWIDVNCKVDSLVAYQALNDPRYSVFSHGHDQTASLTVSGGVPTLQYSLAGSAAGDVGNLKLPGIEQQRYEKFYGPIPHYLLRPDNYQNWGANGSLTAQPSPAVRVTLMSSVFNSNQQRSSLEQAISQLDGEYIDPTQLANTPLIQNDVERATDQELTSTNALTLNWQLFPWLPLTATGGLNTIQRTDKTLIPFGVIVSGPGSSASCFGSCDTTGSYGLGRGTSQDKTLTVGTTLPLRPVTLAVGANLTQETTTDFQAYTSQLAPGVTEPTTFPTTPVNGSSSPSSFNQNSTAWSTYGWYVEPRLNVASKLFISPGFRLDGGSASGAHAGLTGFPKIDLSYLVVDQSHPRGVLTLFRPRVAFGYAGTQPAPTEKLRLFNASVPMLGAGFGTPTSNNTTVVTLDDSTFVPLVWLSTLGNTQLRPERSSELEGGFDADLWHGRLALTYTQYNKTRHDAIISIPVPPSVYGVQQIAKNIGVIRNTGTELTVNAQLLESRVLSWTVGGNLSNDNNILVRLNKGEAPIVFADGTRIVAGYPLFSKWALPIVGFADANHDGVIEAGEIRFGDSAVFVGQPNPKYQLNVNTGVTLLNGRLGVNATFAYQNGLTQDNQGALTSGAFALLPNIPGTSLATQAAVVAAACLSPQAGCPRTSTIGLIQTVNTFRFNALSINYTLPWDISTLFRVPTMSVALQGENLGLHSNYRGKDPSVNAFSTATAGDVTEDTGLIPQPRTWWLKLTIGN